MAEKKLTFEQAMARLEEIVAQLEAGDHPLAESLSLYEEGAKLMKQCVAMLDVRKVAKLRLTRLVSWERSPFVRRNHNHGNPHDTTARRPNPHRKSLGRLCRPVYLLRRFERRHVL